ncbi:hypothetical protein Tco_1004149 [Tanacetum coccineum]|uniref:Uncharacterized protein n=1 Tax=Tanacetum coccineum TaxID=301880 RepID=A0ABQ5FB36_9ASTR
MDAGSMLGNKATSMRVAALEDVGGVWDVNTSVSDLSMARLIHMGHKRSRDASIMDDGSSLNGLGADLGSVHDLNAAFMYFKSAIYPIQVMIPFVIWNVSQMGKCTAKLKKFCTAQIITVSTNCNKMEAGTTSTTLTARLPILNPKEYDLWLMRIEQYFLMTDYSAWEDYSEWQPKAEETVGEN